LRWRCATTLARIEYPEETLGLYSPDEAEDIIAGGDFALVPPKPVLDTELTPASSAPTPSAAVSAAAPVAPAPAPKPETSKPTTAPSEPKAANGNGETLEQKEVRFTKALKEATSKEQ